MEFIVMLAIIAALVWGVKKLLASFEADKEAELRQAWQTVLDDPHYMSRRLVEEARYEEQMRPRWDVRGALRRALPLGLRG